MKKLFHFLKKYTPHIFIILLLLFAQAALELALPDYMSRIVNVGIQQGGIDKAYPEVLRKEQGDFLQALFQEEDQIAFSTYYHWVESPDQDLLDRYPALADQGAYVLQGAPEEEEMAFLSPYLLITVALQSPAGTMGPLEGGPLGMVPEGVAPLDFMLSLPEAERSALVTSLLDTIGVLPEANLTQTGALFAQREYEALGRDLEVLQRNYVLLAGLQMVGIALLAMAVAISVAFVASRVAAYLGRDLRLSLFKKVASFSNEEYGTFSTASLITRSTNDIQQVQMFSVMLLRMVFFAPILGLGGILKALNTNRSMAWVIAVGVMAILTLVVIMFSIAMPKFKSLQKLVDKVNMVLRESLIGLMVIRAFGTETHEEGKFQKANEELTKTNLFVSRLMSVMQPLMMLIMNALAILVVWVGSAQVDLGNMQVGDMMAYIQYTMQIMMSFLMLSMVSIILPRASVSMNRIAEVLDTPLSIKDPEVPVPLPGDRHGEITFHKVSFKYPGAEDYVLKNISFQAKPHETTAFIGSTGSGKSTLVNLLPRFYDATEGEILLNGVNIKDLPLKVLREKISYVPQQGVLFSGTARSNIKYADEHISEEAMEKAAAVSQAMDFILEKEEGFDFAIAQGGSNVSGGQRQRLAIARALATPCEVLIFDDSFSALDYKTDAALRATLKKEVDSTVIIVAQRISTIKTAENIIVLDEGQVVGQGTHEHLMKTCGVYQEIAASQLTEEELGA